MHLSLVKLCLVITIILDFQCKILSHWNLAKSFFNMDTKVILEKWECFYWLLQMDHLKSCTAGTKNILKKKYRKQMKI